MEDFEPTAVVTRLTQTQNADPLLDTDRARFYLDNQNPPSKVTMERWRRQGTGPSWVQMGKMVRYRQSGLDNYIEACTRKPKPRTIRKHSAQ